jgi:putative ABC transport system substrate-binding protein
MVGKAVLLLLVLLTTERAAEAQRTEKMPRLCFITYHPGAARSSFDPFFQGLRDLGYVDGQTIVIDYLSADGDGARFPALADA